MIALVDDGQQVAGTLQLFHAGDVVHFQLPQNGGRIVARTYPAAADGGPDFEACGAAIGGEGTKADDPLDVYTSGEVDAESTAITFMPDPTPVPLDVRLPRCAPPDCDRVLISSMHVPLTGNFSTCTVPTNDVAFAVLFEDQRKNGVLYRWDRAAGALEAIDLHGSARNVASGGGRIIATLESGAVLELNLAGDVLRTRPTSLIEPKISVGEDGTAIALDEESHYFEISATTTVAIARDDVPATAKNIFIVDAQLMVASGGGGIDVYDGVNWMRELTDLRVFNYWFGFGDHEYLGVVGAVDFFERDAARRTWIAHGAPSQFHATTGVHLGEGRALIIAETGWAGIVAGKEVCQVQTGTIQNLSSVALSPDRSFAIIVGENGDPGTEPTFLIADLSGL